MTMTTCINMYGGPGSGKSTLAAMLFNELKVRGIRCEMAREYVKNWAYEKRQIIDYDQIYIMAKQVQEEFRLIKAGVKIVVTDSPVVLSAVYGRIYFPKKPHMVRGIDEIVGGFIKERSNINIVLKRKGSYDRHGRYESLRTAKRIDKEIMIQVKRFHGQDFREFHRNEVSDMLSYVMSSLEPKLIRRR